MAVSKLISKYSFIKKILKLKAAVTAFLCRKFKSKSTSTTVVVIALHKLGDAVFTIPAVKSIKSYYNERIILLCYPETSPIYKFAVAKPNETLIDLPESKIEIIELPHNNFFWGGRLAKSSVRKLIKEINPGIIFDITGMVTSASMIFNSNAKEIIGTNEEYYSPLYTHFVPLRTKPHLMDIALDAIRSIIPLDDNETLKEFPVEISNDGFILLHPFAGWAAKEWGLSKFIELAKKLADNDECVIVSPNNYIPADIKEENQKYGLKFAECNNVEELIKVIKGCKFFIGNDSGPVHIASLLGKPTFTIFGPTNPLHHLPYGRRHHFIQKEIICTPAGDNKYCFTDAGRDGCPSFECMHQLSIEEVYNKVEAILSKLVIQHL